MRAIDGRRLLRHGLAWVLFAVGLLALGLLLPIYWVYLLSTVAVSGLVARGIGLVTNRTGIITLCQMSFAAVGGWIVSWLALHWPGAPFPLLVILAGVVAAAVGMLIGLATARIRGVELAVVTLGFAAALDLVLRQGSFPGVGSGTPVIPSAPFNDPRWFFALAWVLLILLQLGLSLLERTPHGLGWAAVQSSERAAAALGVRVGVTKATAFALGAMLAGTSGGLLAGQYGLLTPEVFTPMTSMVQLATAVLCGASLFGGAVLAGVFSAFIPELLRRFGLPLDLTGALLALGAFDALRRGTGGLVERLHALFQDREFRATRVGCDLTPGLATGRSGPLPSGPTEPCLSITGLSVSFEGQSVLEGVDLVVARGEVHALVGPNGAGKSTLVDAVTGFLPGHGGTVQLEEQRLDQLSVRARSQLGVRRTFQHIRAIESITVGDYLRFAAGSAGSSERIAKVSTFLGLPDGRVPVRLMDAGSRRVLEVAGVLVASPRIALLDEPAAGLSETESLALAERVARIPEEFGCAVLLIEHDMGFVRAAAACTSVLDEGHVISSGSTETVLDDPLVIAAYLGQEVA